jgi:hypothetical protein
VSKYTPSACALNSFLIRKLIKNNCNFGACQLEQIYHWDGVSYSLIVYKSYSWMSMVPILWTVFTMYFVLLRLVFSGTNCNSGTNNTVSPKSKCHAHDRFIIDNNSKRRHKYMASRFRYYPNTDASFNVERNPGPSKSNKTNTSETRIQSLTFVLKNVRSIKSVQLDSTNSRENKLSCFQDIVLANQFDVIALTETWLHNSVTTMKLFQTATK